MKNMVSACIALASNTYNKTIHSLGEIRKYVVKKEKKITTNRMCENKCSKSYLRLINSLNNTHAASYIFHKPNK